MFLSQIFFGAMFLPQNNCTKWWIYSICKECSLFSFIVFSQFLFALQKEMSKSIEFVIGSAKYELVKGRGIDEVL